MKRASCILLLIMLIVCAGFGYSRLTDEDSDEIRTAGGLSEIAEEVVAIPLQPVEGKHITTAREVRKEGNDLFLISQDILYRFNRKGDFICQITHPKDIKVAGYMVDVLKRRLIVLGNANDIYYYSYDGQLLFKKKLKKNLNDEQLMSAVLYQNHIYTAEVVMVQDSACQRCVKKKVSVYDTAFQPIVDKQITEINLPHSVYTPTCRNIRLHVSPDSGEIYAYASPSAPEHLLHDTLYISRYIPDTESDEVPLLPVLLGQRFWFSFNRHAESESCYTFCWDNQKNKAWQMKEGFVDDFYQTGHVPALQPADLSGRNYFYCKAGEEVGNTFPNATDSTVVFIVTLRG